MSTITRARIVSALAGAAAAASLASFTPVAQAASLTTDQVNAIVSLLKSFGADSSTVTDVQAVLSGTKPSTTMMRPPHEFDDHATTTSTMMPSSKACPALARTLKRGASGDDVKDLQAFLGAPTTGIFGPMTAEAVRHWQEEHGVVATGTPVTGGAGSVGPKTRMMLEREIQAKCGIGRFKNSAIGSSTRMMSPRSDDHQSSTIGDR